VAARQRAAPIRGAMKALGAGLRVLGVARLAGILAVVGLQSVLILPLPTILLDLGLAMSLTAAGLVLMVAPFLNRPLDFTSFPTLLLLTTLLRLSLTVAVTRLITSHGNEGPLAAGYVVATFGGFLMGGVVVGLIVFGILLVVNFMVITKGSGRIPEVAARFSLDSMPGKQMAIDADLSAGLIDEKAARRRRKDPEEESGFYGAMDGAAKFVRGDAIAGLIITIINIIGGLAIGVDTARHAVRRCGGDVHHADGGRRVGVADSGAAGVNRGGRRGDQGRHRRLRRCGAGAAARW
jgi:flagellar biosynthesis protein FlhA